MTDCIRPGVFLVLTIFSVASSAYCQEPVVLYSNPEPIFALESGEFDGLGFGEEIIVLQHSGHVVWINPLDVGAVVIDETDDPVGLMKNRPTLSVGTVTGDDEPEIVVAANNLVRVLSREDGTWSGEIVYDITDYLSNLWGARVGDYDLQRDGLEVMVINETVFDFSIGEMLYTTDGVWSATVIYEAEVAMDTATGDFDPTHEGEDTVIATEMGRTYQLLNPFIDATPPSSSSWDGGWPKRLLWDDEQAGEEPDDSGWVVKVGDVDPNHPGEEIVYGTRYKNHIVVSYPREDGSHERVTVFEGVIERDRMNMWDIAVGDILSGNPGDEIAAVDDTGAVYLVWNNGEQWESRLMWDDGAPLYAVTIAEVDPNLPGREIVVAGENGDVRLVSPHIGSSVDGWSMYQ